MSDTLTATIPFKSWMSLQVFTELGHVLSDHRQVLEEQGIIEGCEFTEFGRELVHGYLHAIGIIRMYGSFGGQQLIASAWVADDRTWLIEQRRGDESTLLRGDRGMLPLALIDLLTMGPRPRLAGKGGATLEIPRHLILDLFDEHANAATEPRLILARALRSTWPDVHDAMVDGQWRCWMAMANKVTKAFDYAMGREPADARIVGWLGTIDTPAGLLCTNMYADPITLTPLTTAILWQYFSHLVPPGA